MPQDDFGRRIQKNKPLEKKGMEHKDQTVAKTDARRQPVGKRHEDMGQRMGKRQRRTKRI